MAARQAGETVRLNAAITDVDGDPGDPSEVKIAINKPDGTEALPATDMVNLAVGSYYYDYLIPSDLGTYSWNVTATGAVGRITIVKDIFSVNSAIGE